MKRSRSKFQRSVNDCLVSTLTFLIIFSFHFITATEDSTLSTDSLNTKEDSLVLKDTVETSADDSLTGDTSATAALDSVPSDTAGTAYAVDTMQMIPADTVSTSEPPQVDTVSIPRKALRKIIRDIQNGLRLFLRFSKHFLLLIISCGVILFTILFYRKKVDSKRFMTSTRLSVMDREVQLACKFMEINYADPELSVESICKALVTGTAFLEALFDRELGMSVTEFLTQVRINRAKQLIKKKPELDEEELLTQIGFSDRAVFIQKFKEITDITFEEYCASLSNQNEI